MHIYKLWQSYFRMPLLLRLLATVAVLMFSFGLIIHLAEPQHFTTIFDGIWWAFVTGSTVGYGDYVPLSNAGRIIAILLILSGGGVVTFYMAAVSATTLKHEEALSKGNITFKGANHIIFIGWNERTRQLLELMHHNQKSEQFVLIDQTLNELPYRDHSFHFVHGDPTADEVLQKANINKAKYAIVTADPAKKEHQADQASILTTVALRGNNPDIHIITEVLTKNQITNAKRAGANTIIRSNDFMSTLFYQEIFRTSPVQPFELLLEVLKNQQFTQQSLPQKLEGKNFLEVSDYYVASERLLIGIIRNQEVQLNPPFQQPLIKGDTLLLLEKM
ncbi:putative potassium channel protein YugO [Paraliobacillus quinghaiensis]|uniref:Potassium channel protein YugO n=1 Tax=Paraliobacillus quinghaiensis TaxID=470815 RepID=A0A917TTU1_9BACI|nr:potassium channel family protein [Paraliobacillus quinghaiensis]GGM37069.1 putative potassium channel protein YugO [Paraliobacillus quinghaiensis]